MMSTVNQERILDPREPPRSAAGARTRWRTRSIFVCTTGRGPCAGGYLRDALARPPDETLLAPVLADAEVVEKAMLRMKKLRPHQYKALRAMYIFRYGDLAAAAEVCRVSPARYRQLVREGYNYLAGNLSVGL